MSKVICPHCSNELPPVNYCIFCGGKIGETVSCENCKTEYNSDLLTCPTCHISRTFIPKFSRNKLTPWYIKQLLPFDSSVLIIFIFSSYFIIQSIISLLIILTLPFKISNDAELLNILTVIITIISNVIFVILLVKIIPFTVKKIELEENKKRVLIKTGIIFLLSVVLLEISLTLLEYLLDFLSVPPAYSSPYDDFFTNPLITFFFSLLVIIIGPLFEEIVFRQHVISFLEERIPSKYSVAFLSSIIFSLNHLPADLQNGSLRYMIEHFYVVFFLGIILALIYYRYGLVFSFILHSLWNTFSLLTQLGSFVPELVDVLDLLLKGAFLLLFLLLIIIFVIILMRLGGIINNRNLNLKINFSFNSPEYMIPLIRNMSVILIFELFNAFLLILASDNALMGIFLLLFHTSGLIIGFLIFEYKTKTITRNYI
jgi:membrane protease YdiL (CAAX protease family)